MPVFAQRGDYGQGDVAQCRTGMSQSAILGFRVGYWVSPNGAIMAGWLWPIVGSEVLGLGAGFRVACLVSPNGDMALWILHMALGETGMAHSGVPEFRVRTEFRPAG